MSITDITCDRNENRTDEPELLPCPFCRGDAKQRINRDKDYFETYFIECPNCKNLTGLYAKEEESIKAWNRRVPAFPDLG